MISSSRSFHTLVPTMTIAHGTVAGADEHVLRHRRTVDEVPLLQLPLLALDHEHALAGDDEEVLLRPLAVVHARRHTRVEHDELEAELLELGVAFEVRRPTKGLPPSPRHLAGVDDEGGVVAHGSHPSWYRVCVGRGKRA